MIRFLIPIVVIVLAVSLTSVSAAEDRAIQVGSEFRLLADGPGEGIQRTPHVAFGGGVFVIVWQEGWHGEDGRSRIYAARVTPEGKVLDPGGIQVAAAKTGVQEHPRVAFGGGVFLVVWQDLRNGKDADVLAARLSPEGKLLDAEPIPLAAGPGMQALPDVAIRVKSIDEKVSSGTFVRNDVKKGGGREQLPELVVSPYAEILELASERSPHAPCSPQHRLSGQTDVSYRSTFTRTSNT